MEPGKGTGVKPAILSESQVVEALVSKFPAHRSKSGRIERGLQHSGEWEVALFGFYNTYIPPYLVFFSDGPTCFGPQGISCVHWYLHEG